MCNEQGGVIDDLYAYKLSEQVFLLIINATRNADVDALGKQPSMNSFTRGPCTATAE